MVKVYSKKYPKIYSFVMRSDMCSWLNQHLSIDIKVDEGFRKIVDLTYPMEEEWEWFIKLIEWFK